MGERLNPTTARLNDSSQRDISPTFRANRSNSRRSDYDG
jgi:hypothetical protein